MTSLGETLTNKMSTLIPRTTRSSETNQVTFELNARIVDLMRDGLDVVVAVDAAVIHEHVKGEYAYMAGLLL